MEKLKPYTPEWQKALEEFLKHGQELRTNPRDRKVLAAFSEAGQKLGWIVPIEK
jgi:hypothetical protein